MGMISNRLFYSEMFFNANPKYHLYREKKNIHPICHELDKNPNGKTTMAFWSTDVTIHLQLDLGLANVQSLGLA